MGDGSATARGYRIPIASPLYFRHPSSLEHDTGFGHPERAERIVVLEQELDSRDWLGWRPREAPRVELDRLLAVHPQEHVDAVRELSARGGAFDADTPTSPGSYEAALRSSGGACAMVEALLGGEARWAFSALRPPGHHAEPAQAMGFCLFNNVAVAARHALDSLGAERVLIFDWDVHHGNGTNAIFGDSRDVLFASIHQYPFYPGTGPLSDSGSGEGEGYSINLPVPGGSDGSLWLSLAEHVVMPAGRQFRPDLILVSAGYDAHKQDPVGDCDLDTSSFAELTRHVRALADELGVPVGCVLEGGYDLDALAASAIATMESLTGGGEPRSVPLHELAAPALEQVGRYWQLGAPAA
jgi:acetoin utilization deacetylase AcuC-like enzyme